MSNDLKGVNLKRLAVLVAVLLLAGAATGSAFAFDCIRVSSSLQGLMQSAKSGHWLPFNFGSVEGTQQTLESLGADVTEAQAECFYNFYAASGEPQYFALGIGVAGGFHSGPGVLAWNNPNDRVLANGKGIDHLEDSGILDVFNAGAAECGVPTG
jgi:hypothetical protein